VDTFNPSTLVVQSPVTAAGDIELDPACYEAADGRTLEWTRSGWPDLTAWINAGGVVEMRLQGTSYPATVTAGSTTQTVKAVLTYAQANVLVKPWSGPYEVRAVKYSGSPAAVAHLIPLLKGTARVNRTI
jgi:hypothetical protein